METEITEVLKNNEETSNDSQKEVTQNIAYLTMTELLAKRTMYEKQIKSIINGDDRILKGSAFVSVKKKVSDTTLDGTKADFRSNNIKSSYDRLTDLIHNYQFLTSIKNQVNATVKVQITESIKLTIAEALAYLNPTIKSYYESIINKLTRDYATVQATITDYNNKTFSPEATNAYIATVLGGNVDKGIDPKRLTDITDQYHANNDLELVDPINIADTLSGIRKFYTEFYTKVNFVLSEVNAQIKLSVNYTTGEWNIVSKPEVK